MKYVIAHIFFVNSLSHGYDVETKTRKKKVEEINLKNEEMDIKLTLKDFEISKLKNQKQLSNKDASSLIEKNKLKEELEKNILEIEKCIESIKLS